MEQTSIAVSKKSKEEWERFKNYKQESFEAMINRSRRRCRTTHCRRYFRNRTIRKRHQKRQV
jgi:hypothetical protein